MKNALALFAIALLGYSFLVKAQSAWPGELLITPEKTDFLKTSTHADVMKFMEAVSKRTDYVHIFSMGKSPEGKEIPVAVLANPSVKTAGEAKASGKLVVYVQGNVHGGEVEGKEALMMLMRDILLGNKKHLLENQIILIAPVYNADSNDKMEKGRRPSQEDSPLEVGIRENSQGLDLNRDGIKMEAVETKALFENIITKWDPQVFVDLHTTNGTWHAYSLTWAPSYHYAGEAITYDYVNNKMLKEITKTVLKNNGLFFGPYGDYDLSGGWPPKDFFTYNHHPRYLVNQFSLRNRMAILSEAFSHERFYQRIHSTYAFVNQILDYAHRNFKEIIDVNKNAEASAIKNITDNAGKVKKGVRFQMVSGEKLNGFRTYDYIIVKDSNGSERSIRTGNIVTYDSVNYHGRFEARTESLLPNGYIIPEAFSNIAGHLQKLGVKVEQLSKPEIFTGDIFRVSSIQKSDKKFEGHFMATVKGDFSRIKREFKKGDYVVDLAQPLANLIFYLLEPESDDGLVTWNFFDEYFEKQKANNKQPEYPVFKYYK